MKFNPCFLAQKFMSMEVFFFVLCIDFSKNQWLKVYHQNNDRFLTIVVIDY